MSDAAVFNVNLARWQQAVGDISRLVVNASHAVVKDECRKLVFQLVRHTPPFFTNAELMPKVVRDLGEDPTARKIGERAVERDFPKMFVPMKREFLERLIAEKGNLIDQKYFRTKTKETWLVENMFAGLSIGEARRFHERKWANGRLSKAGTFQNKTVGRWIGNDKMAIPFEVYNSFLLFEKIRVGSQKAGWVPAARDLGLKVPSWISNNFRGQGRIIDSGLAQQNPRFAFANSAKGIKRMEGIVGRALRDRAISIENNIKRMIKYGPGKSGVFHLKGVE